MDQKPNETIRCKLRCQGLDGEGRGLVSWEGKRLAIPALLEGELASLELLCRPQGVEVHLLGIENASPLRRKPPCSLIGKCGGCQLQHLSYEGQLAWKQSLAEGLLSPYGRVLPILGMEKPVHYRHKVHAAFADGKGGRAVSGVYQAGTHRILPVKHCLIEDETADAIIASVRELMDEFRIPAFDEESGHGILRHVLVRRGFASGQIMVVLVAATQVFPARGQLVSALRRRHPDITTVVMNLNQKHTSMVLGDQNRVLFGPGTIEDTLCGCVFRISPGSFYPANPLQAQVLYGLAMEYADLTVGETVIDAYCGIGAIGLIASRRAGQVVGVEVNRDAVKDAVANARRGGITNARFYTGDAGQFMAAMAAEGERADVVFLDPPRSGCDSAFLSALLRLNPARVIYVSCSPAALARDLAVLAKSYRAIRIQPVDMFPQASHVECVVELCRK